MRVLVTRPEPDAARTASQIESLGHRALVNPLLRFEPVANPSVPRGPFAALAATSANAFRGERAALHGLRHLPLFAVGDRTAEAARAAGFANVSAADGEAASLARFAGDRLVRGDRVLHLAGEDRAQDLGALLAPAGIRVEVLLLYRMRAAESFGAETVDALRASALDAALHYSPRSARVFGDLCVRHGLVKDVLRLRHLCLSQAVAAPLADIGIAPEVAARPDEKALLNLLGV